MTPFREILTWLGPGDRLAALMAGLGLGLLAGPILGWGHAPLVAGLGSLSLAVVRIDGARFLIPDLLVLPLMVLGLADAALGPGLMQPRLMTMLGLGLMLLGLRAALSVWRGRTAMGLGDVKFLVAAAAWLPLDNLPVYVFAAALSGLIEVLLFRPPANRIAFGRHLAPWLCVAVLSGPWLARAFGTGSLT